MENPGHFWVEINKRVGYAARNGENAAAQRAELLLAVAFPAYDADGERSQKRRVMWQDPEAAACVLRDQAVNLFINEDRERGDDLELHLAACAGLSGFCASDTGAAVCCACFWRASSNVPTI